MKQEIATQKDIDQLNKLVMSKKIQVISAHAVWGVREYESECKQLKVTMKVGQFYGGGISDNYWTLWLNGTNQFTTDNSLEMDKAFLNAYAKL